MSPDLDWTYDDYRLSPSTLALKEPSQVSTGNHTKSEYRDLTLVTRCRHRDLLLELSKEGFHMTAGSIESKKSSKGETSLSQDFSSKVPGRPHMGYLLAYDHEGNAAALDKAYQLTLDVSHPQAGQGVYRLGESVAEGEPLFSDGTIPAGTKIDFKLHDLVWPEGFESVIKPDELPPFHGRGGNGRRPHIMHDVRPSPIAAASMKWRKLVRLDH